MFEIKTTSFIPVTPRAQIYVEWKADNGGFTILSMKAGYNAKPPAKGPFRFPRSFDLHNLNDDKMEKIHAEIQYQINQHNSRYNRNIGDLPKLTKITGRAILPQGVA